MLNNKGTGTDERRRGKRIPLNLEVSYTTESRYKVEILEAEMINISDSTSDGAGGICLRMAEEPSIGSNIMLKFTLPNSTPIFATGKIKWVEAQANRNYLAGVEFDLDEDDLEYIKNVIRDKKGVCS